MPNGDAVGATLAHAYLKAAHHDAAAGIWAADEAHLRSRCGAYVEQPMPVAARHSQPYSA